MGVGWGVGTVRLSKAAWSYRNWVNSELSRPISCCAEFRAADTRPIPIPAPTKTIRTAAARKYRFKQSALSGQGDWSFVSTCKRIIFHTIIIGKTLASRENTAQNACVV